jgi:hypothetical protein
MSIWEVLALVVAYPLVGLIGFRLAWAVWPDWVVSETLKPHGLAYLDADKPDSTSSRYQTKIYEEVITKKELRRDLTYDAAACSLVWPFLIVYVAIKYGLMAVGYAFLPLAWVLWQLVKLFMRGAVK